MATAATRMCSTVALVLALLASTVLANAEALPPLELEPPVTPDMLLDDLALITHAASRWLLELDERALAVWVWRAPADPNPEDVFADNAWLAHATRGVTRHDLHETMLRNVEYYAPFFDREFDPTWSDRARAFANTLIGLEQTLVAYSLLDLEADMYLTVDVTTQYIDLLKLRLLEGTYVRVTRLLDH